MTDKPPLHDIAPYPRNREEADADALIRYYAAFGEMHSHLAQALTDKDRYKQSIGHVVNSYMITYLLSELRERAGWRAADEVAREMWEDLEGGALPPILWEYVSEEGMSHEAIAATAKQVEANIRAELAAASAPAESEVHPGQVAVDAEDLKRVIDALARASHHWDGYRPEDHDAMARLRSSIPSGGA
ncbi:hypothetical protein [Nonomuraea bangladeshensis]|uniref:hypothetical protein n=1 Tax=Nonomuraea bangladeshensis TaxID=404385 RepID=UPI003C2E1D6A